MEFRLLGAVEADIGGQPVELGPVRQRCLFVTFLVEANHILPVDRLADRVWEGAQPNLATLYSYVSRLRHALATAEGVAIVRRSGGYVLTVDPETVDLHRFRRLVQVARQTRDADQAAAGYSEALALWRDRAFSGLDTPWINQLRATLDAERHAARLERNDLMLGLGRHTDVLADITALAAEHPLDERLACQLVLALYRTGRRADALRAYQDIRSLLLEELGLDTGPELRQLHQLVLNDEVAEWGRKPERVIPRQLPADTAHFTGRALHLAALRADWEQARLTATAAVVVICGMAGVGKTSLAVRFAHEVVEWFPDGQLYLDLRGSTSPLAPVEALGRLLRGLDAEHGHIPAHEQELTAAYRSLLAGRRVLFLLDDARNAEQISPLLPGTPGCLVVVTSRATPSTLENVHHVDLDVLTDEEALTLLSRLVGRERVEREPDTAMGVVRMCAGLPLAVRIAGARLVARPTWDVATLADRFADEQSRLDELRSGDRAVRAGFALSYEALLASDNAVDRAAARAFRLLGALDWIDLDVPIAAALLDVEGVAAREALERLVDDHLLDSTASGRYDCHDLLRLYGRDLALRRESEHDRRDALLRVLHCYLDAAEQANLLVNPHTAHSSAQARKLRARFSLTTEAEATTWVDAEHANLMAVARQALQAPDPTPAHAVRLTAVLNRLFDLRGYWRELIPVREAAAEVARRLGDRRGEAFALQDVAWASVSTAGQPERGIACGRAALGLWRELDEPRSAQACLNILGYALRQMGRLDEALECLEEAAGICRHIGHRYGLAATENHLGLVHQHLRRFDEAIDCHERALALNREVGDRSGESVALANLGWAWSRAGQPDQAVGWFQRGASQAHDTGDRYQEAEALWGLGGVHHLVGNHGQARACWHRSITILREIGAITGDHAAGLLRQPVPDTPEIILRNT
ncbi:tetratricopeptide repeat protein [Amycolatopsis balhimycina DSM 5908]|uniref:Tetratricopeptide repeat protein n=1 Tax=Amycolatopsis balhimycina DSM 5908 TaxID=1081091 RepID=A0A428W4C9_AMYBA|nr:BTAD domain-containing putative transcriptional regulator [Amycolatopsis balhimycina]RSM37930.1 tetratricopeptide repeat protein [Amycolatopsis balhimycina DSM 5908]